MDGQKTASNDQVLTGCAVVAEQEFSRQQTPLSSGWISPEMLEKTRVLWSRKYGRELSEDEATMILINVKSFAELLLRIQKEGGVE